MKIHSNSRTSGFTLIETVIAIGVLAVLLTGFMVVFTPAADGIRKSINVQQADRLASTLENELVTLRVPSPVPGKTGFDKAFDHIVGSTTAATGLVVYQYRATKNSLRNDGTPSPLATTDNKDKIPGENYSVVSVMRKLSDTEFKSDLRNQVIEGSIYLVKCTQMVFANGQLSPGTPGTITDPAGGAAAAFTSTTYPEAVIAFTADFYMMPAKSLGYFDNTLPGKFAALTKPVFSRNLAVRR
jgi:prepilin-type N-terminal cleavage/methylation domain-containing protein